MTKKEWMTTKEAAAELGVAYMTVMKWIYSGKLKAVKLGHRTMRVSRASVKELLTIPESRSRGGA